MNEQTVISKYLSHANAPDFLIAAGAIVVGLGYLLPAVPTFAGAVLLLGGLGLLRFKNHASENSVRKNGWHRELDRDTSGEPQDAYKLFYVLGYEIYRSHEFTIEESDDVSVDKEDEDWAKKAQEINQQYNNYNK